MIADIYHEYNIFTDAKRRIDVRLAIDVVPARNQKALGFFYCKMERLDQGRRPRRQGGEE